MLALVKDFAAEEDGATAIEYGLIAGLVAVVLVVALSQLGTGTQSLWGRAATRVGDAMGGD